MALCVDSPPPHWLSPVFCARSTTEIKHRTVIICSSQSQIAAPSVKRKANAWITLLQKNPPDVLAYNSCFKPFFMFVIYWHSKCGFVFTGWNSRAAACRLRRIYRDICPAKANIATRVKAKTYDPSNHLDIILGTRFSRPRLRSSGQSSWLQIQRSGFDSLDYQIF
jgi:hypothetical protein